MKRRTTVLLTVAGLLVLLGGALLAGPWAGLQEQLQHTALRTEAQTVIRERALDLSNLSWRPDRVRYAPPGESRRAEVAEAYRKALQELSYALYTADTSGLPSYYAQAALEDARRAASSGTRQRFVTWDHWLTLRFYAPKGNIAAFTDLYRYSQWTASSARALSGQRRVDVVMRQGQDGQWRLHQWQVTLDVPRALARGYDTPETARLRPCRT